MVAVEGWETRFLPTMPPLLVPPLTTWVLAGARSGYSFILDADCSFEADGAFELEGDAFFDNASFFISGLTAALLVFDACLEDYWAFWGFSGDFTANFVEGDFLGSAGDGTFDLGGLPLAFLDKSCLVFLMSLDLWLAFGAFFDLLSRVSIEASPFSAGLAWATGLLSCLFGFSEAFLADLTSALVSLLRFLYLASYPLMSKEAKDWSFMLCNCLRGLPRLE